MPLPKPTAENYDRIYPETGRSEADRQDSMERLVFNAERTQLRRTGRTRGIVVPDCPYFRNKEAA
jgi:hypothetical protein